MSQFQDASMIRAEFIEMLNEDIEMMTRQLDALSHALIGCNTVIALSEGMYLRNDGGKTSVTCITRCSRWEPKVAARICEGDNVRDGAGNVGKPVRLHIALETELARSKQLLANVQARA